MGQRYARVIPARLARDGADVLRVFLDLRGVDMAGSITDTMTAYRANVAALGLDEVLGLYNGLAMVAVAHAKPSNFINLRVGVLLDRLALLGYDIKKLEAKP